MALNSLSMLIHGESGTGKTRLGDTAPAPRLILDAEGGIKFTPSKKTEWEDPSQEPPEHDGSWDTCVVTVTNFQDLGNVFRWLKSGKHPFKSVVIDSLTDVQERCMEAIVGTDPMKIQDWGELLRKMQSMIRSYRDLTMSGQIDVLVLIALTQQKDDKFRPMMSGQIQQKVPGYVDVVGYMHSKADVEGEIVRKLLTHEHPAYVAKDRTDRLPDIMENPTIPEIMDTIFNAGD